MKSILVVLLAMSAACATGYQSRSFKGGYSDYPISSDQYHVDYKVNGYTDPDMALKFARRRASELTLAAHKSCYRVLAGNCGAGASIGVFNLGGGNMVAKPLSSTCSIDFAVTDDCDQQNTVKAYVGED
jgi:hypothetical protein